MLLWIVWNSFWLILYFFQNLSDSDLIGTNLMLLSVSNRFRRKIILFSKSFRFRFSKSFEIRCIRLLTIWYNFYHSFKSLEFSLILHKFELWKRLIIKKYFFSIHSNLGLLGTNMLFFSCENGFWPKVISFQYVQIQVY